jgi:hypothetical protein
MLTKLVVKPRDTPNPGIIRFAECRFINDAFTVPHYNYIPPAAKGSALGTRWGK